MSEFSAALLRCQLERLESQTIIRDRNATVLSEALEDESGIIMQQHTRDAVVHTKYM